jgi:hypothetical protein
LYRESATGTTPLELSQDIYTASQATDPPGIVENEYAHYSGQHYLTTSITYKSSTLFIKDKDVLPEESKKRTWEICAGADLAMRKEKREVKRRIVSLLEANEVAKRLSPSKRDCSHWAVDPIDAQGKADHLLQWIQYL